MGIPVRVAWAQLGQLTSGSHRYIRTLDEWLRQVDAPWDGIDKAARAMKRLGPAGKSRQGAFAGGLTLGGACLKSM